MGNGIGGQGGRGSPWIFKHGTNTVDRGLNVLFFGLFLLFFGLFFVGPYPEKFSADAPAFSLYRVTFTCIVSGTLNGTF